MAHADIFAVAALETDLLDLPLPAAKIGVPNGAAQSTPLCSSLTWSIGWVRQPKPERHDADRDGLAHQELLRALSGLVVIVVDAVVGGLEAIVFLGHRRRP
jgi:hypothetical protein